MLKIELIDNKKYFSTTYRGTEYTLYEMCDSWFVSTKKISLGRLNAGGGKYFKTLADVCKNCKAFGTVENLTKTVYGF